MPLYYTVYSGNLHNSMLFHQVLDEIFGVVAVFADSDKQVTVVFDKGMNSAENISHIDGHQHVHFVTTYSPYLAEYEVKRDPDSFDILDITKNRQLMAQVTMNHAVHACTDITGFGLPGQIQDRKTVQGQQGSLTGPWQSNVSLD